MWSGIAVLGSLVGRRVGGGRRRICRRRGRRQSGMWDASFWIGIHAGAGGRGGAGRGIGHGNLGTGKRWWWLSAVWQPVVIGGHAEAQVEQESFEIAGEVREGKLCV